MAGIGMNFATTPGRGADIESTLVHASALDGAGWAREASMCCARAARPLASSSVNAGPPGGGEPHRLTLRGDSVFWTTYSRATVFDHLPGNRVRHAWSKRSPTACGASRFDCD
jgi:hypothetical protein